MPQDQLVCVAKIGAAHGIRGEVRLWSFTEDPLALADYGPLATGDGKRHFEIASLRAAKDHLVARLAGIDSREAAEGLNGLELYIARDMLPPTPDDEFYHADLIGLKAVTAQHEPIGQIVAMHNFGAGDIVEIAPAAGGVTMLLPFTNAVVPSVDIAGGYVVVVLPDEIDGDAPDQP